MALKKLAPRQLDLGQVSGFEVQPESPVGNQVAVAAGNYLDFVTLTIVFKAAATSPAFTNVAPGNERWDLLYYSTGGVLSKAIGVAQPLAGLEFAGVPAVPLGSLPLAYIHVDETGAVFVGSDDITDVRSFFNQPNHRNLSGTVTIFHDSAQSNHTKAIPANWNVATNPQTEKILLDELAARVKFQETSKTFLSLTDTFASYVGRANQFIVVNGAATGLTSVSVAGLPNVMHAEVQSYLEVNAAAVGTQTATVIIGTPLFVGTTLPPNKVTLSMHVWTTDDFSGVVEYTIDIDVYRAYEPTSGFLAWYTILQNRVFALGTNFVAGTYAPDALVMTLANVHLHQNGPWYRNSTSTPIGTPLTSVVAGMKHLASLARNPYVSFSWNAGLQQLTVTLESDIRATAMFITTHFDWNAA